MRKSGTMWAIHRCS